MADTFDPFAAAGFRQADAPVRMSDPFDPFAAAGFAAPAQAPPPPRPKVLFVAPNGRPIFDDPALNAKIDDNNLRMGEKMAEGATFGMFPHIVAAVRSLGGSPYSQALQEARDYTKQTSEENPALATAGEVGGSLASTTGLANVLTRAAAKVFPSVGRYIMASGDPGTKLTRRVLEGAATGAGVGGAVAAGNNIGQAGGVNFFQDTAHGAGMGAGLGAGVPLIGAGLQAFGNIGRGAFNAARNALSDQGRDAVAGQIIREAAGDFAATPAVSPIPGLALRPAQATGNPGLASLERTIGSPTAQSGEDVVQMGVTPRQTLAVLDTLVGPGNATANPNTLLNASSQKGVGTIRAIDAALKGRADELWNDPALENVVFHGPTLAQGVAKTVAQLPASWRDAVIGPQAPLKAFLREIEELGPNATIKDINSVRSRILEAERDALSGVKPDRVTGTAAGKLADALLDQMDQSPAFASATGGMPARTTTSYSPSYGISGGFNLNPQTATTGPSSGGDAAREAYQRARDFTRVYRTTRGYPEFDPIFRRNYAGNIAGNDEALFSKFFDTRAGTSAGTQRLQDLIDLAEQSGYPNLAKQLGEQMQTHVRSMVNSAGRGAVEDAAGRLRPNVSDLAYTGETMLPAVGNTPALAPLKPDLEAAVAASRLLGRPMATRSEFGSPTYDKLRNEQLISAILGQSGSSALGALGGGAAGYYYAPKDLPPEGKLAMTLGGAIGGGALGKTYGGNLTKIPGMKYLTNKVNQSALEDIKRRIATGLASDADYQALLAAKSYSMPNIGDEGAVSRLSDVLARRGVGPALTARSERR